MIDSRGTAHRDVWTASLLAFFTMAIFAVDAVTPLGITVTTPYVLIVLVAAVLLDSSPSVILVALACSALTIAGFFLSPAGTEAWLSLIDRGLVLFVLWETTVLSLLWRRSARQLQDANQQLEQRVQERTGELSTLIEALRGEIDEHARTEQQLRSAKEASEEASRAKSDFLATMSHELRTPLHVIIGYGDLLKAGEYGPVTNEQSDVLERLGKSAWGLFDLVSSVIDLNRLESGRAPVEVKPVDLKTLLAEVDDATLEIQQQSGLTFRWEVAPDLPPLHTDAAKLRTILRNLIGNAVKFTPTGTVTITATYHLGGVEFSVADTGLGIAPESLDIIFEPFQQLESGSTRAYGGAGLGLHIVKRLAELLDGRVSVESSLGHGSTFSVWLPNRPRPNAGA